MNVTPIVRWVHVVYWLDNKEFDYPTEPKNGVKTIRVKLTAHHGRYVEEETFTYVRKYRADYDQPPEWHSPKPPGNGWVFAGLSDDGRSGRYVRRREVLDACAS